MSTPATPVYSSSPNRRLRTFSGRESPLTSAAEETTLRTLTAGIQAVRPQPKAMLIRPNTHKAPLTTLLVYAVFLSVSCAAPASRRPEADTKGSAPIIMERESARRVERYEYVGRPVVLRGILVNADPKSGEMVIETGTADEPVALAKVRVGTGTAVALEGEEGAHPSGRAQSQSAMESVAPSLLWQSVGQPVIVACRAVEGEPLEASWVILQTACKMEYCPHKNCRRKCGAKTCVCPKKS